MTQHSPSSSSPALTFPQLLQEQVRLRPQHVAIREKYLGIWQSWSFAEVGQEIEHYALGLASLGFSAGMNLAVIGDNRPRLYWAMMACQCLGGGAVPLYQDSIAEEVAYIVADADIDFAIAENQEQVDKLLQIRETQGGINHIIFDDPRGLVHYRHQGLMSYEDLLRLGREFVNSHPGYFQAQCERVQPSDLAVMLYTSGTTGKPKGVRQSHQALIASARGGAGFDQLDEHENVLSYLPMAWVGDCLFSYAQAWVVGFAINCPESSATVQQNLREIGPSYYFAPPRVFEAMRTQVLIRMEDASALKKKLFHYAMNIALKCGAEILVGQAVPWHLRLHYVLCHFLIYGPLKNTLGLSRIRVAYTAGAAIGPDLFRFYRSLGINLKQLYGQTETCAYVCLQPDNDVRLETVGKPAPGVEIKLADNGEVLVRGVGLLQGYHKRADATAEAMDSEGYFHTGDAGVIDHDGHLKIIDRAQDVGRMHSGQIFAPNYVENKLKFFPEIKEAVAFGDQRDRVCVLLNIDLEAVGNWAERRGLAYSGYTDLAAQPEVYQLLGKCIKKVNQQLALEEGMEGLQIHRYLILHKELDADDEEITRTRKVRRGFIAQKYAVLVEALYSGKSEQFISTQVKFEDGRRGEISATLTIADVAVFPTPSS